MEETWELAVVKSRGSDLVYLLIVVSGFLAFLGWLFEINPLDRIDPSSNKYVLAGIAYLITGILLTPVLSKSVRRVRKSTQSELEIESEDVRSEISEIRTKIRNESDEKIAEELALKEAELQSRLRDLEESEFYNEQGELIVDWVKVLFASRRRLIAETSRLSARSSTNLVVGILTTAVVISYLLFVIFVLNPSSDVGGFKEYLSFYLPHATLVIIVQFLAGFFLRLFVGNERDIQRNKNEITNIELRLASGMIVEQQPDGLLNLSARLACEERNFVLEKKEKAVFPMLDKSLADVPSALIQKVVK